MRCLSITIKQIYEPSFAVVMQIATDSKCYSYTLRTITSYNTDIMQFSLLRTAKNLCAKKVSWRSIK